MIKISHVIAKKKNIWTCAVDSLIHPINSISKLFFLSSHLDLLVDGLQEFSLMVADSGMVNLLDKLRIFVDEPGLPQYIGCCVFYLQNATCYLKTN